MALVRSITGPQTFTDPVLTADQTKPKAAHMAEVRDKIQRLVNDADAHIGNYGSDHHKVVDTIKAGFMDPSHIAQLAGIEENIDELWTMVDTVPRGAILMWSGSVAMIPIGFALCDGTNGTPDLRDKFVVGAGSKYNVGASGGEEQHTLTPAEMPSHVHGTNWQVYNESGQIGGVVQGYMASGNAGRPENFWFKSPTESAGGNQAHNNMPPYYAMCFIMRTTGSSYVNIDDGIDRDADTLDSYHASDIIKMINDLRADLTHEIEVGSANVSILTGAVFNKGIIPLPAGYTQEQCKWMISLRDLDSGKYTHEHTWADENRVVTCYDSSNGGGWANYIIIGVK
jgi:hypothetical protein